LLCISFGHLRGTFPAVRFASRHISFGQFYWAISRYVADQAPNRAAELRSYKKLGYYVVPAIFCGNYGCTGGKISVSMRHR